MLFLKKLSNEVDVDSSSSKIVTDGQSVTDSYWLQFCY